MKNNKTLIKKWELNGSPYLSAELRCGALREALEHEIKGEMPEVWLTDDSDTARQLLADGACCIYLLTAENRDDFGAGIEWCVEVPEVQEDFLWRVWLRSHNLPWHICETDRLALREMTEADLDFLYEMQADEEAARFLDAPDRDRDVQRQKLTAYRQQMYGFYGFGIWVVIEKESGQPVGRAGLQIRDGFEEPELGFAILKKYRRRGYAEEACRAVLDYAKDELELKKVRAVVDGENAKSRRLCEKLGFTVDNLLETDGREWIFYSRGQ